MFEHLVAAGYKLTTPRRRVVEALRGAAGPRTAQEVAEMAGTSVASTYRVLALLVSLGVVSELEDGGMSATPAQGYEARVRRYALCTASGHHHHFICRSCHAVIEVASEALERVLAELGQASGLSIDGHEVTLRGQCARCQDGHDGWDAPDGRRGHEGTDA